MLGGWFKNWRVFDASGKVKGSAVGNRIDFTKMSSAELSEYLRTFKTLNQTIGGSISSSPFLVGWSMYSGVIANHLLAHNTIRMLKNWNYQRWDYQGLPEGITKERIEDRLFTWGNCVIWKDNNKFRLSSFSVKKVDYMGYPKTIKPIFSNEEDTEKGPVLTIGKDCAIFWHDAGNIFIKSYWGPLWALTSFISDLCSLYENYIHNLKILKPKIVLESDADNEVKNTNLLIASQLVAIPLNKEITGLGSSIRSNKDNAITFPDYSESLLKGYNIVWEEIKKFIGISSNSTPDKKERQIQNEIKINNVISDSVNKSCEEYRIQGIEEMNKLFGLSASVKLNEKEQELESTQEGEKENENNQ